MKKLTVLAVILLLLFLAASTVSVYFTSAVLLLPEDPEGVGEALGAGLTIAVAVVFVTIAAAVEGLASLLSLIGLLLTRRALAGRGFTLFFSVFIALPILLSAVSYLLILL